MKIRVLTAALMLLASAAQAQQLPIPTFAGQEAAKNATPTTPEDWLIKMTDFTRNGSAFRDPKVFGPWLNTVTEPNFYSAVGVGMFDPAGWLNMVSSMTHPDAARNMMWVVDPAVYMRWMQAGMDPAFYTSMLGTFTDPGKMMRWMMSPMDNKMWVPMQNMMNPNAFMKWGTAAMDPRAWQIVGNVMNPALYTGYMGSAMTPFGGEKVTQGLGGFGNWFSWTPPNAPTGTTNPWGTTTGGTSGFNFMDPVAMMGMFGMGGILPSMSSPATTPSYGGERQPSQAEAAKPAAVETKPAVEATPASQNEKISLAGDALFKLGKSGIKDLSTQGKASLDELASKIAGIGAIEQIRIVGHADATGKAASNQRLSEARAASVKAYLASKGVKPEVMLTSGMGSSQPVVECDMKLPSTQLAACLSPNRRVEVEIVAKR